MNRSVRPLGSAHKNFNKAVTGVIGYDYIGKLQQNTFSAAPNKLQITTLKVKGINKSSCI